MLLMTSKEVFYSNKIVVLLLDIQIFFTTSHDVKVCPYLRLIRSARRYVLVNSIPSTAEISSREVGGLRPSMMETYPFSFIRKVVSSFSTYYSVHVPSSASSRNPKLISPLLSTYQFFSRYFLIESL